MDAGVSVLVPTKGAGVHLGSALESIRESLHEADEVVIQDSVSMDRTSDAVRAFASMVKAEVRFEREEDAGQADALQRALLKASRPYVVWLNADDQLFGLDLLRERVGDSADVTAGGYYIEDSNGSRLRQFPGRPLDLHQLLLKGCYQFSGSVLMKRDVLMTIGGFNNRYKYCMDYDLFLRLARLRVRCVAVSEPVASFQLRRDSKTGSSQPAFVRESRELRRLYGKGEVGRLRLESASVQHWCASRSSALRYSKTYSAFKQALRH